MGVGAQQAKRSEIMTSGHQMPAKSVKGQWGGGVCNVVEHVEGGTV